MTLLRRGYGASPLHLLAHAALLAAALWVVLQVVDLGRPDNVLLWFVGAILLHDVLALPLYTALDRAAQVATRGPAVNYVRVPVALSGLLLLVYFPLILDRSGVARLSGEEPVDYLSRWLIVSGLLFAGSALVFVVRRVRGRADG